jgi:hypothetical protein
MADTEVKGGFDWQQLAAQIAQMAAQLQQMRDQMKGYVTTSNVPSRADVLNAIYANRPDLQNAYAAERKKDANKAGDVFAYMERWIAKTTEKEIATDPLAYAKKMRWITSDTTQVPTLEREKFDADKAQAAAALGVSKEQFEKTLALQTRQADEQQARWAAELGMSKDQFEKQFSLQQQQFELQREQAAASMGLSRDEFEWQRDYQAQQLGMTKDQFEKQFGLQERQFGFTQQQAEWQKQNQQAQLALDWAALAAQNTGPRNAFKLWNIQQMGAKTQLPAWQQVLQNVLQQQGLGGAAAPAAPGMAGAPTAASAVPAVAGAGGIVAPPASPGLAPQKVAANQWQALTPSAQQGVLGYVEQQGYYPEDWYQRMLQMQPKGQASPLTAWRY